MITAYKHNIHQDIHTTSLDEGLWINMIEPSREEVETLIEKFNIPEDFLKDPLDADESARVEFDDETGYSLIIIDIPIVNKNNHKILSFMTIPLGIVIGHGRLITVCDHDVDFLEHFTKPGNNLHYRSQLALNILVTVSNHYNRNLRLLNKSRLRIERDLKKSVTNKQLYNLMEVEKSLVYFLAALKGNEDVFKRLFKLPPIKRFEEDEDLIEDLFVETNQAIETTELHTRILESITTSYESLLSNDMNTIMKTLTLFTVFLTLPTLVFSFFGMNVPLPINDHSPISWIVTLCISLVLVTVVFILLWRRGKL
ncbi:magnesium transporter CorA family protein [Staphylococcus condimenti]|uniref:Magnesium transporter CorA family protein n=1 Tax=Staphylococcus condimenti TaxID=70255 RepID=A0A143PCZ5_9STAP|nr:MULTISPECIES: magnesium transporter CorA family protein [Staphylococcus]AMY06381.1 magnesium transporter CorA [Staphylococcus condimenti]APR60265.1 magnesium transporter CorA [Staphylococcus condimenti]OFP00225.1 magnesium transporter CorA [Staphylococcus sp. HMSC065E08]PNZ59270.1 magnesium transporter CorA family protein [Staphylococcus condimenti]QQS81813.1 magnesium transporter CorA family protein [Staphylococcus condimenti]